MLYLEALCDGLQLFPGYLVHQWRVAHGVVELLVDGVDVLEEALVVFNLLVEDGGGLLVELGGDVVTVDQGLSLVQPLSNLSKVSRQAGVQQPLPVAHLAGQISVNNVFQDIAVMLRYMEAIEYPRADAVIHQTSLATGRVWLICVVWWGL